MSLASIVIPAFNEGVNLKNTVESIKANTSAPYDVVVVNDGSTDGCCGFLKDDNSQNLKVVETAHVGSSKARNLGASEAKGDLLVFMDAHVSVKTGWLEYLSDFIESRPDVGLCSLPVYVLGNPDVVGYGMTLTGPDFGVTWLGKRNEPAECPIVPGAFFGVRRKTFSELGMFDKGLVGWGIEDIELSIRAWLMGYSCRVLPDMPVGHLFRSEFPYSVSHCDVNANKLRTALLHFSFERFGRVVDALKGFSDFPSSLSIVLRGDALVKRRNYFAVRKRTDDWFFSRFGINF